MILIVLTILITLFDLWSTDYTLRRGATENNIDFMHEHWLTKEMIIDRGIWTAIIGILFALFGNPILIVYVIGYGFKMIKNNLRTIIKLWDKPIIY